MKVVFLLLTMTIFNIMETSDGDYLQMEFTTFRNKKWFTVYGFQINKTYNPVTLTTPSYSVCREICFAANCPSVSMVKVTSGTIDCRMMKKPKSFTLMQFEWTVGAFFYTTDTFGNYKLIEGKFYLGVPQPLIVLDNHCHAVYGGIYPTLNTPKDLDIMMLVLSTSGLSLKFTPFNLDWQKTTGWIWDDGTLYSRTEMALKYHLPTNLTKFLGLQNYITFSSDGKTVTFTESLLVLFSNLVCQFDPFHVPV